jgi:mono/diheme cytochrome c family protein
MQKIVPAFFAALLAACSNNTSTAAHASKAPATPTSSFTNGHSIFLTGKDSEGFQIMAASAPLRTSCAACHRPNGAGGVHLPGGAVSADLRYKALVTNQKHPYTLRTLERAISTGIDNEGKPLNPVMPRWKMMQRDLHDVAAFVQTLH